MNNKEIQKRLKDIEAEKQELENMLENAEITYDDIFDHISQHFPNYIAETATEIEVECNDFILCLSMFAFEYIGEKITISDFETHIVDYVGANKFIKRFIEWDIMEESEAWIDLVLDGSNIREVMQQPISYVEKQANNMLKSVIKKYPDVDLDMVVYCIREYMGE